MAVDRNHGRPRLAATGAGLPNPELLMANLSFRWGRWRPGQEAAAVNFVRRGRQAVHGAMDFAE